LQTFALALPEAAQIRAPFVLASETEHIFNKRAEKSGTSFCVPKGSAIIIIYYICFSGWVNPYEMVIFSPVTRIIEESTENSWP
jgi:hypothetical protein